MTGLAAFPCPKLIYVCSVGSAGTSHLTRVPSRLVAGRILARTSIPILSDGGK
ncbi:MAG: hypothetical protein WBM07_07575 [Chitinivibrionales bacterium]